LFAWVGVLLVYKEAILVWPAERIRMQGSPEAVGATTSAEVLR
jgi:hypothetical protein